MSGKSKVGIGILGAVLILLLGVYVLVDAVYVPQKEQVIFPEGELVDSIFVAQNNEYVENSGLATKHSFETVPYMVDVPKGNGAKVGTGKVYQVGDGYFAYVSEYNDQYDIQDVISSQFPVALLINYIPESTRVTVQQQKQGYINGFKAQYIADTLYVTDGAQQAEALVLGYVLDVPEGPYFGNHMFVAVGTTNMTSADAVNCAQVLSAVVKTARYDKAIDETLTAKREKQREEEAAIAASIPEQGFDNESAEDPSVAIVGDEVTESVPIVVPSDYSTFTLDVSWTLNNPNAVLEFFFPDGNTYASPLSQTDYDARFALSNVSAGTYTLRIMHYQECGEIATTIGGQTIEGSEPVESSEVDDTDY